MLKYCVTFITGQGIEAAGDGYFSNFISSPIEPVIFNVIFLAATCFVVFRGVNKGIESLSKILMPVLLVLVVGISIYALTIQGGAEHGNRTGMEGFLIYVVPDVSGLSFSDIFVVVMDAMGQLFFSISVAMGIMVTYGSYFSDKDNLMKSVNRIEIFDTIVAFLAGVMVIPAVYVFLGQEGMAAGPGLMFVAMPKIFAQMGIAGRIIGCVFFIMVLLAALTSSVSVLEAVVSGMIDKTGISRKRATLTEGGIALILGILICMGYNLFYFNITLPNGTEAQILDVVDYFSNNILMPILAIGTCILIGWIVKPKTVIDEVTKNGERFGRKALYKVIIKFIAPVLLFVLFLGSLGVYRI